MCGVLEDLVSLLGEFSPRLVTYAGGASSLKDLDRVRIRSVCYWWFLYFLSRSRWYVAWAFVRKRGLLAVHGSDDFSVVVHRLSRVISTG